MRKLGTRDRKILELRFFEGWTQEQIAKEIGVTQMQVSAPGSDPVPTCART